MRSFNKIYFWTLGMAALLFLLLGFTGGMMFCDYLDKKNTQTESKQTTTPKASPPAPKKN